jgi:hypothetical protein
LDALIAEKVMGWGTLKKNGNTYLVNHQGVPGIILEHQLPPYSTDIAAAWEVVKRVNGVSKTNFYVSYSEYSGEWWAQFQCRKETWFAKEVSDHSVPHAICLAALRAVGHDSVLP